MSLQKNLSLVRLFARMMQFGVWLQNVSNKLIPPPFRLIQLGSAFWQSRVLYVAARLDIATALGEESLNAEMIAARVDADADAVYRLLRMLAAMGLFEEVSSRVFKNNALSAYLRQDRRNNVRAMILMHNSPEMSLPWFESLEQGIRSGAVPFQRSHGQALYEYMDRHAEFDALFSCAMDSVEALIGDSFACDFDWGRFERIIDVGGSKGGKALTLLKRHPHLKALVFDRPSLIQMAPAYWAEREQPALLSRLDYQGGDLFESVPKAQSDKDIYFLSAILHGMNDEHCIKILRNLAEASAGSGARIALMECVLPESKVDLAGAALDMQMLMATQGRERTLSEWQALFDQGGWTLEERVGLRAMGQLLVLKA